MTDLETLKAMLDRAGIEYVFTEEGEYVTPDAVDAKRQLQVERGYSGFVTVFGFNDAGDLVGMGAWE